jgi:hypothetical protein
MDATMQTVLRLHEQGIPRRTIAKRAGISLQKVRKILITAGAWSDETSEKSGSCVRTVCQFLKSQKNWV